MELSEFTPEARLRIARRRADMAKRLSGFQDKVATMREKARIEKAFLTGPGYYVELAFKLAGKLDRAETNNLIQKISLMADLYPYYDPKEFPWQALDAWIFRINMLATASREKAKTVMDSFNILMAEIESHAEGVYARPSLKRALATFKDHFKPYNECPPDS